MSRRPNSFTKRVLETGARCGKAGLWHQSPRGCRSLEAEKFTQQDPAQKQTKNKQKRKREAGKGHGAGGLLRERNVRESLSSWCWEKALVLTSCSCRPSAQRSPGWSGFQAESPQLCWQVLQTLEPAKQVGFLLYKQPRLPFTRLSSHPVCCEWKGPQIWPGPLTSCADPKQQQERTVKTSAWSQGTVPNPLKSRGNQR